MAILNYWWVSRPKRKLNSIPEVLGAFQMLLYRSDGREAGIFILNLKMNLKEMG